MSVSELFFADRSLASQAAAGRIAAAIDHGLREAQEVAIVGSGGSTPENCYEILSDTSLPWERVRILPSDERCVPIEDAASNEGMMRRRLKDNLAADVNVMPLYEHTLAIGEQCAALTERISLLPLPFAISLLGAGDDGHFASLFADAANAEEGLDAESTVRCLLIGTPSRPEQRVTLTLATLLQSREVLLLLFGLDKREMYEQAKLAGSEYPLSRLLQQERTPIRVLWAP